MANWLPNYPYRKALVVTAGVGASTLFQYPIKVYAGSGVDGSETLSGMTGSKVYVGDKCGANFGNVTFTSSDGTTELSHWQQTVVPGVSATFWVKTPDTTVNQAIYFYYGFGASKSNQANTFVDVISGVVGAWNMEEANAADPVIDYSGNGNNGTATGTDIVSGRYVGKNARQFVSADANNKIVVADNAVLDITSGSWFFNFKPNSINVYHPIMYKFGSDSYGGLYSTRINNNNTILSLVYIGGLAKLSTTVETFPNGWGSVLAVHNGATITQYVQGVLTAAAPVAAVGNIDTTNEALVFGTREEADLWCNGVLGNVILFSSSLNASQALNLASYYPDVSLEAGKVLVRKYATTTQPSHTSWGNEETDPAILEGFGSFGAVKKPDLLGPPVPHPTVPNAFMEKIKAWLTAKTKLAS